MTNITVFSPHGLHAKTNKQCNHLSLFNELLKQEVTGFWQIFHWKTSPNPSKWSTESTSNLLSCITTCAIRFTDKCLFMSRLIYEYPKKTHNFKSFSLTYSSDKSLNELTESIKYTLNLCFETDYLFSGS